MGVHYAALFRYQEYRDEVWQFVEQVDQQNYELLKDRVCQTIEQFQDEWPLSDLGFTEYKDGAYRAVLTQEWPLVNGDGGLATIEEITKTSVPTSRDLGYWFLILLAKYLKPCISPLGNWRVLYTVLKSLGWSKSSCKLLFYGFPTYKLLKPQLKEKSTRPLTANSAYWLWLQPSRAWSGWLPNIDVDKLLNKLSRTKEQVDNFELRKMPDINVDNPVVIENYQEYLHSSFDDTLAMLSIAKENQSGLFMSITV